MLKIRKLTAKDRLNIYEILQQIDMLLPMEIDMAMARIDAFLFNKEDNQYTVIVAENEEKKIFGYACYGYDQLTVGTYYIHRIAISPVVQTLEVEEKLIIYIEMDIINHKGCLIIVKTPSNDKYDSIREIYLKHHYQLATSIQNYYAPGIDQIILIKKLNRQGTKSHKSIEIADNI